MQIHSHARRGDVDGIARELKKGVSINAVDVMDFYRRTPLMLAAKSHQAGVATLRFLIGKGADVNAVSDGFEETALGLAASTGDIDRVNALVDAGADISFTNSSRYTVLLHAMHGRMIHRDPQLLPLVRFLIERGADMDSVTPYGESALSVSSNHGRFDVVKCLLDAGADPKPLEWNPLMYAIAFGEPGQVATVLEAGADVAARDFWSRAPWLLSLQVGDVRKAEWLLRHGANRDDRGRCGKTNLMYPAIHDHVEMLKWLLDEGAEMNAADDYGYTALMTAAEHGSLRCVEALLEAGADAALTDHVQANALSRCSDMDIIQRLLTRGGDVNYIDGEGYTLLKRAAEDGLVPLTKRLLELGADPDHSRTGDSALHTAVSADELDVVKILLSAGADPNQQDVDGWSPLCYARSIEVAEALLAAGADPSLADGLGDTAASVVREPDVRRFLQGQ